MQLSRRRKSTGKRLPHLKIEYIMFRNYGSPTIEVCYKQKYAVSHKYRDLDCSDSSSTKFHILTKHYWILEDSCHIQVYDDTMLEIRLIKSLLEISYGNAIRCELDGNPSNPAKLQEALLFHPQIPEKGLVVS